MVSYLKQPSPSPYPRTKYYFYPNVTKEVKSGIDENNTVSNVDF